MNEKDSTDGGQIPQARVLIVDDVADNRAILGRRFLRRGFEVAEAESGHGALELIEGQDFDVVLLDVMMPDLNGLEVLRRIRAKRSEAELPVIMVTGKTDSDDVVKALTAGANDYITKPVDFSVALARVNAQAARRRAEEDARRAHEQLRGANEQLEQRIAERTAELVQINAQLRIAIEESQAANRAKDDFLAIVSHELRTPLNGMVATSNLLTQTPLNDMQTRLTQIIETSAEQMNAIVNDLLDMLDLASGGVVLAPEPVRLEDFVEEAAAATRPQADGKGLSFSVEVADAARGTIAVDRRRLLQALGKLLNNAVKFTEAGEVRLCVTRPAPDKLRFEVRDTGIGLSDEAKGRLFRPFEQADSSYTRRFGGLGLGLAISRGLVALMGGEVTGENGSPSGAVFRVELPA